MKFSIITVCHNSEQTIEETINNLSNQTFSDYEHIIVDGFSNDNTANIIRSFEKDKRIRAFSLPKSGVYNAINFAIKKAKGEIIFLLHSDDVLSSKNCLESVGNVFDSNPNTSGLYSNILIYKKNITNVYRFWRSGKFSKAKLKFGWMPPHTSLFIRREVFEDVGLYNESYKISSDYDFILRLGDKYLSKFYYLPEVLVHMRAGGLSNKNFSAHILKEYEDYIVAKKHFRFPIFVVVLKVITKIPQLFFRS